MKENRLFLDIHVIQTLPPSNINRDDTGSPKTAQYGGVTRARVSSQCWKSAMRKYFEKTIEKEKLGVRTKKIVGYLGDKIIESDNNKSKKEADKIAEEIFELGGIKNINNKKVPALFHLGNHQTKRLVELALGSEEITEEAVKDILKKSPSIDIALFGRMIAGSTDLNIDASSQVAHGISTHEVRTEFDYFVAMDDLQTEDEIGAAMIETTEFNSSTIYRYANVALHALEEQLCEEYIKLDTIETAKQFVEAFVKSMPTGKSNSFANQTLPQALVVSLREDRPVNLVSAFEVPIRSKDGYVKPSIEALAKEMKKVKKFAKPALWTCWVSVEEIESRKKLEEEQEISEEREVVEEKKVMEEKNNLGELLNCLGAELEKWFNKEGKKE